MVRIILCALMLLSLFSCRRQASSLSEHYYLKDGAVYFIPGGNSFERGKSRMEADVAHFSVIGGLYARDQITVFYQGCPQRHVDAASFRLKHGVPVDKQHVYFASSLNAVHHRCAEHILKVIPDADPTTFETINDSKDGWAKDSTRYFYRYSPMQVDRASFRLHSQYIAQDKNQVYRIGPKTIHSLGYSAEEMQLLNANYAIVDRHRILYATSHQARDFKELSLNPVVTPEVLDQHTLRINRQVIYKGRPFAAPEVDARSFEVLENSSPLHFWSRDHTTVFYNEQPVENADPSTLEVLYYAVAKDVRHVYLGTQKMDGIDARSFRKVENPQHANYNFIDGAGRRYRYKVRGKEPQLLPVK